MECNNTECPQYSLELGCTGGVEELCADFISIDDVSDSFDGLVGSLARDVDSTGLEIIKQLREISKMTVCSKTAWTAINFAKAAIATLEASNISINKLEIPQKEEK